MIHSIESYRRPDTIIVVPCYNEAQRLDASAFDAFLDDCKNVSLIFVDDGSTDDTPLAMERLRQRHATQVCTLRLGENVGKAEAVRRGVQIALRRRPTFVGYWDADLATPLEAIPHFCDVLNARSHVSLVMGSRVALLGRQIQRKGSRHLLGRAFATAASLVLKLRVYDTQCGAKLFRVTPEVAELFSQPFAVAVDFRCRDFGALDRKRGNSAGAATAHESIYEYPLERWQDVAGSRLKSRDFFVAAVDLAAIYWRYMRAVLSRRSFCRRQANSASMAFRFVKRRKAAIRQTVTARGACLLLWTHLSTTNCTGSSKRIGGFVRGGRSCGRWWSDISAVRLVED